MNRKFPFLAVALMASIFAPTLQASVEAKPKIARVALAPQNDGRWFDKSDKKDPRKPKPKPGPRGGGDEDS